MKKLDLLVYLFLALLISTVAMAEDKPAAEPPADKKEAPAAEVKADETAEVKTEAVAEKPEEPKLSPGLLLAEKMIGQSQAALKSLKDFTAIFHKKEWKKGKQLPTEITNMKFRTNKRSVYMLWIGEEKKGQEVIWIKGENDGKIKAHAGGFLKLLTVNLDPTGSMAMKDSRHPISEAGFHHTVGLIAKDMKQIKAHPEWNSTVSDLGVLTEFGAKSHCYEAVNDKAAHPEFYSYKARICMDLKTKMPNHVQIWDSEDGKVRLIEDYGYERIKINPGLTDADFNYKNEEYKF